jgi:hypothetical protein
MRFNLAEIDVVKNEAGLTNIVNLTARSSSKAPPRGGAKRLSDFEFTGIDTLNLSLGKLRYVDLKNPRNSRELVLNVRDRVLKNVKSESDLYGLLILIWLRKGGSLAGAPMLSPPEIITGLAPNSENAPAKTPARVAPVGK